MIEQVMSGTAFGKITAVYGQIDENGLFVRKLRFAYGQNGQKYSVVRKFELNLGTLPKKEKIRAITTRIFIIIQLRTGS
ncbi:hypothetical protein [Ligilactobacillus ruminis]|uniref:hypothetical protein n=1 Tax=Ligilactobacillus ruminis TaxID=1623 RepID=UPI0015D7FF2D|nr:hypothetical protein [Ligilactobacillus ruminis]